MAIARAIWRYNKEPVPHPGQAQTADKLLPGGLEGPQVRNLNLRGERWPRPPLVSVDSSGSLCHLRWQVPTGHTLPSVPLQSGFVSPGFAGRAGSLRPWAQTFLKHLAKKATAGGLFRQPEPCVARFPCTFPRPR